ncbi:substrate-binding domain-containing protein [Pseudarthrobacter sp. AL07]|uniref:substrate-binding domain-containing protein n=1 Tax=unclassified Pseudarthrobacter TaxID=2647000 RepID=UPI00249A9F2D|nr:MULTISPECIES: substrate-binding domain-containing protein [unclassified Pseudarthrobacter]MDI3193969.1 substrate-binding domain-containing protein [Pseudarthrobacter sp. AL20]MDI3208070.1 substrate-binding domain-containing protein [Pseudarthrobacter sp. AL07]
MHELLVRGVKVPSDVAVVGFDDIEEARFASPSLTTVSPGVDEIAERSIGLLIDRIDGLEAGGRRGPRGGGLRPENPGFGALRAAARLSLAATVVRGGVLLPCVNKQCRFGPNTPGEADIP